MDEVRYVLLKQKLPMSPSASNLLSAGQWKLIQVIHYLC